jgi:hypothetical protein
VRPHARRDEPIADACARLAIGHLMRIGEEGRPRRDAVTIILRVLFSPLLLIRLR